MDPFTSLATAKAAGFHLYESAEERVRRGHDPLHLVRAERASSGGLLELVLAFARPAEEEPAD